MIHHPPITVLLMAGGNGTRFWPLSTPKKPKQFIRFLGEETMIQLTYKRLQGLVDEDHIFIVTQTYQIPLILEQLPTFPLKNIISEPLPRDTSAAIMLGAAVIHRLYPDSLMVVLATDHLIEPVDQFQTLIKRALVLAQNDSFITFGVHPTFPSTAYGYIKRGNPIEDAEAGTYYPVERFEEKPKLAKAQEYLQSRLYLWNSGILVFKTTHALEEIKRFIPLWYDRIYPVASCFNTPEWEHLVFRAFEPLPKISFDYAVMEKTHSVVVMEMLLLWNDIGNWVGLKDILPPNAEGHHIKGPYYYTDSANNIVVTDSLQRSIVTIGISDCIIVASEEGTLVCRKDQVDQIKPLVQRVNRDHPISD